MPNNETSSNANNIQISSKHRTSVSKQKLIKYFNDPKIQVPKRKRWKHLNALRLSKYLHEESEQKC